MTQFEKAMIKAVQIGFAPIIGKSVPCIVKKQAK